MCGRLWPGLPQPLPLRLHIELGLGVEGGDLSSAVPPSPSASLASQAVLRGQQASCLFPLRR